MCGIAGAVELRPGALGARRIDPLLDAIAHRGPDGAGTFRGSGAVIGARRLRIVDPTPAGDQPMSTPDARHHLVFNGELYDHHEQRRALEATGHRFRSRSDTEVVLALLARGGEQGVAAMNGMFAFALWDEQERTMLLGRDRFGEKPLFYAAHDGVLWFASEEAALFAAGVPCSFDEDTWPELLLFRSVAGERTPFDGVRRVLPGHVVEIRDGAVRSRPWDRGLDRPRSTTPLALRDALRESVQLRLQADRPVGVLLSGGLDSSAVAVLAAAAVDRPLAAFTVTYPGHRMDEAVHAREVASAAGLDHHEISVRDDELPGLLEDATRLRGVPLTHAATTHLVALSRHATDHVKVLLCGEGADELFGGYPHYAPFRLGRAIGGAERIARALRLPQRETLSRLVAQGPVGRIALAGAPELPGYSLGEPGSFATRLHYAEAARTATRSLVRQALWYDQHTHLQAVLDHVDRATMAAGIETRAPFLAPDVAAIALAARTSQLFDRRGKRLLRRAVRNDLPASIVARRKQGWSAPWRRVLREEPALRELVRSLPSNDAVRSAPLAPGTVERTVAGYLEGQSGTATLVWLLVRVAVWHEVCVQQRRVLT